MSIQAICPCADFVFPVTISNPPGLSSIAYRVGDFADFRHAILVTPRDGEVALVNWRPGATADLALQMVEWWAYLADILTFYNERIANQDYLRTADLPESVGRLIRVLGYRPRPGIGATGTVAALLTKQKPTILPAGFQIQSKPGPGQTPQIFELAAAIAINPPDAIAALPAPNPALIRKAGTNDSVLVSGVVSSINAGDELLVVKSGWNGSDSNWAFATVLSSKTEKAPDGTPNTRVLFDGALGLQGGAAASDYKLLKNTQSAHPWQYPAAKVIQDSSVDLEAVTRSVKAGDVILFEATRTLAVTPSARTGVILSKATRTIGSEPPPPQLASVTTYTEAIWFANAPDAKNPQTPPTPAQQAKAGPPIPIPHSQLKFSGTPKAGAIGAFNSWATSTVIRFGWQSVGTLIASPATTLDAASPMLEASSSATFPGGAGVPVIIEDANGNGASANSSVSGAALVMQLNNLPAPLPSLTPPLNVLYGLLQVSRGKTIANEVLGGGDATQAGQEFVLTNAPLTYLLSQSSISGQNYASTLTVRVNGVAWSEVENFYGRAADEQVFVTREDENNKTHVMFGDGVNGARLPSGINNVVATYRFGSGAVSPGVGALSVIAKPQPNLKAIHNPVAAGGGADPDPPDQIRRYAPQSVLAFGRAISADDYETIAAQAPGVSRARSYFAFDANEQRAVVMIYVGDDQAAVGAAKTALALADDPNKPVVVNLAVALSIKLHLTLLVDPRYDPLKVAAGVTAALIDAQSGLLGASIGIGETVYNSEIFRACLSIAGAIAVHALQFEVAGIIDPGEMHSPGVGKFFQLSSQDLFISTEAASDAG